MVPYTELNSTYDPKINITYWVELKPFLHVLHPVTLVAFFCFIINYMMSYFLCKYIWKNIMFNYNSDKSNFLLYL